MNVVAYKALTSILAIGGGGSDKRLTLQSAGLVSGIIVVFALWILSNLWRPPETRWRWGKSGRGRVPASDFAVIAWALTLLCFGGRILASGLGADAVASTFDVMVWIGFALIVAAGFHDYIRAAVDSSQAPPEPPPATRDEPPDNSNA